VKKTNKPFKNTTRATKNGLEKTTKNYESATGSTSKKLKNLVNVSAVVGMNIHVVWTFIT